MKILYTTFFFLILTLSVFSQEVTTLTNITANGGISIDKNDNLLVAHFGPLPIDPATIGKDIYKISPDGEVSLFVEGTIRVGSGNNIDSKGFLYQSNFITNTIYKIDTLGNIVDASFATVINPVGILVDENDNLYVCSCGTNTIRKITTDGENTLFASGTVFNCANGITIDDDGNIYTTNFSDGRITKISPDGGTQTLGSTPVGNGHIAFRSTDQSLYIANYSGHRIYKMDLSGEVEVFAGTGIPGTVDSSDLSATQFLKPNGIAFSNDECTLYVSQDENVIRAILFDDENCSTTKVTTIKALPNLNLYPNPTKNRIFFDNDFNHKIIAIQIVDLTGKIVEERSITDEDSIDLSNFKKGVYSILFRSEEGIFSTYKVVIQ